MDAYEIILTLFSEAKRTPSKDIRILNGMKCRGVATALKISQSSNLLGCTWDALFRLPGLLIYFSAADNVFSYQYLVAWVQWVFAAELSPFRSFVALTPASQHSCFGDVSRGLRESGWPSSADSSPEPSAGHAALAVNGHRWSSWSAGWHDSSLNVHSDFLIGISKPHVNRSKIYFFIFLSEKKPNKKLGNYSTLCR